MERPRDSRGRFVSSPRSSRPSSLKKPGRIGKSNSQYTGATYNRIPMKRVEFVDLSLPPYTVRRSPSRHVSPPRSLNCQTWAGCVYSSMARDASSRGMKLKHGIDDMHKLLHTTKREYPEIYAELRHNPNAWLENPRLVTRVRKLYVPKVGYNLSRRLD